MSSDIVFCRTWYKVDVTKFYTPITTLLQPPETRNSWKGVRTTGEIKREKGIRNNVNQDHLYIVSIVQLYLEKFSLLGKIFMCGVFTK